VIRNRIVPFVLALTVGTASIAFGQAGAREVLVLEAGKHSTAIILSQEPTSSAQYAALELQ